MKRGLVLLAVAVAGIGAVGATAVLLHAQDKVGAERERKVRGDRDRVTAEARWIYDDLPKGIAEAKASRKPLLVVLRCIPCEACAKLDEDVVQHDPMVAALLDRFVCVRIPKANGLDLAVFQYDYDQSWAAFYLNADLTIYGRYGTRSHQKESDRDVSLEGFARSLEAALAVHEGYPANRASLAGKRGAAPEFATPEDLPSLKGRYTTQLDYEGKVVKSCMHCHQVGEAQRLTHRAAGRPIPEKLLFPYPNPRVLGIDMDPKQRARVRAVAAGSSAERDGFRAGDDVATLEGQPVLSTADIQWVLHGAGATAKLRAEVVRDGKTLPLTLSLDAGWRRRDDISWRVSSWDLRRMVTGGMLVEAADDAARKAAGVKEGAMALVVRHVGQHGEHAVAKKAGFRKDDVLVSVDGRTDLATATSMMVSLAERTKPGDQVVVGVVRGGERLELTLTMQ